MSSVTVVTSCSLDGWNKYGQRFMQTYDRYWPLDVELHLVSEDVLSVPVEISTRRAVLTWNLMQASEIARTFYERHKNKPESNGTGAQAARTRGYNFRFDAVKFSKKVFAIKLIADCLTGAEVKGRLIWVDADTITYKEVPRELLERMPPEGSALACLDRGRYHSECGWIAYDLGHPAAHAFISHFAELYSTDAVFTLQEWHDSWVFDWLRRKTHVPSHHIPHKSQGHPFVHSELGKYMDHLKGTIRKAAGSSHDHPRFHKNKQQMHKTLSAASDHDRAKSGLQRLPGK